MDKDASKVAGGIARAKSLTPEKRTEIAKRAASTRWGDGAMRATHMGELKLGGSAIPCAVLEDGRRIISLNRIAEMLGRRPGGHAYKQSAEKSGRADLPVFLRIPAIIPFVSEDLANATAHPISYRPATGGPIASGLPASILPEICGLWLDARRAGSLNKSAKATADRAEILLRALADVGINALVDEATGYQEIRDRFALQAILDKYLRKEYAAWAKRFPDEFYRQIFRLRNWEWRHMKGQGPRCLAGYTNDMVYQRLAPGVLSELEARNPLENGRRRAKHHQWLTADVGHPQLSEHLAAVIALMRVTDCWDDFKKLLDRGYPKLGDTIPMLID